jgi:hypothetical protein
LASEWFRLAEQPLLRDLAPLSAKPGVVAAGKRVKAVSRTVSMTPRQKADPVALICYGSPASSTATAPPLDPVPETPDQSGADPPEFSQSLRLRRLTLDRFGFLEAIGGLVLGLIALFSSYDHITVFNRTIALQQQWGILFIAASVATVFVDAELASRSRLRAARDAARAADEAAEERKRQAREAQRQGRCLERLDQTALLSARVQLDPSSTNRARLQFFLTLLAGSSLEDPDP